ncbi:MAG: hypothetical protein QF535_16280, partial [Anaerolineales bacterium]|nr:hypothetical protein [Anaerolineales bacterium]
ADAFRECRLAKMEQTSITIEGDPIITTVVIEGEEPRGCMVRVHTDSRDNFGFFGIIDTKCYRVTLDTKTGRDAIFFEECLDGTQKFLY